MILRNPIESILTQFYKMEIDPSNPDIILGGTQDNGTIQTEGDPDYWEKILGGDGFYAEIHPDNPNIIYAEYQWGQIRKTIDGGENYGNNGHNRSSARQGPETFRPGIAFCGRRQLWVQHNPSRDQHCINHC